MTPTPRQNALLAALPSADYVRLLPHLESIEMPAGFAVYESGGVVEHLYFPTSSTVALLCVMEDGASAQIALTGREGLVGISLFMGGDTTPSRALVACAGHGYRLRAVMSRREFALGGSLQFLALRFTQALITQMAQTAVCNRHHSIERQLCRLLLLSLDRLPGNEVRMTQESIAGMLGVRREGVTEAAGRLQAAGILRYARGLITVQDRTGLEERACECYAVVEKEYDRLLGDRSARPL